MHRPSGVLIIAMDVSIEHRNVVVSRQHIYHVIPIAGKPLPIWTQIKQWTMRKDHDRCAFRKSRQIFLQPIQLLSANLRFCARDVVESTEVNTPMIERVVTLAEELPVQSAAIQSSIVLSGNALDQRHIDFL